MFGKADGGKNKCKGSEIEQVSQAGHETVAYKVKMKSRDQVM